MSTVKYFIFREKSWKNGGLFHLVGFLQNNCLYFAHTVLYFHLQIPYSIHVPNDRYVRDDKEEHIMLRLLGILTLGNMIFGGHRRRHHRYHGSHLGRSILLGTLLGLFVSRANREEE